MRPRRRRETETRTWGACILAIVILAIVVFVIIVPVWVKHQTAQESCSSQLALHPLRFTFRNLYNRTVWVNVEYSSGPTETWALGEGETDVIYTKYGFRIGENVTVTFRAAELGGKLLPDKPKLFQVANAVLVFDENYHEDLEARMTMTTTRINYECVTRYVLEGPTVVFGP